MAPLRLLEARQHSVVRIREARLAGRLGGRIHVRITLAQGRTLNLPSGAAGARHFIGVEK